MFDSTSRRKPEPAFLIRLHGPRISPGAVPLRQLTKVLESVQRLFAQELDDGLSTEVDEADISSMYVLHLLKVKSGSAAYVVGAHQDLQAADLLSKLGRRVESPQDSEWSEADVSSIRSMSDAAKSIGCDVEFRMRPAAARERYGALITTITPETSTSIECAAFVHGRVSQLARIERVGGATDMHCGIRLPSNPQKMVICGVATQELVRNLGQFMYRDIVVHGQATWFRKGKRLKRIEIDSFDPPKSGSILAALEKARNAGGDAWDSIRDPDEHLAEMR